MHLEKPTLLIVDDDSLMLETLARLLAHFGFNVLAYSDSVMAMAAFHQRNDIAMIVCDYEMPEINGEEFARAVKEKNPNMPIFILSGSPPPDLDSNPWDAWFLKGAPITGLIRKLNAVLPLVGAPDQKSLRCKLAGDDEYDDAASVS